jgi:hypothetical protein
MRNNVHKIENDMKSGVANKVRILSRDLVVIKHVVNSKFDKKIIHMMIADNILLKRALVSGIKQHCVLWRV